MNADWRNLTRGRATFLIRLLGVVSIIFAVAGLLLLLAPQPQPPALGSVAQAAPRRLVDHTLLFPKYSDLTSTRATPFEFQALDQTKTALRKTKSESTTAPSTTVPSPPPKPDVSGLILVGTAPGETRQVAVLRDEQSGQTTQIVPGDEIRNSVVKEILADKIVLALNEQESELTLASVQGSDNLSRQLQGLPPLPEPQASATAQRPGIPPPSMAPSRMPAPGMMPPSPGQATGNATLAGASSNMGGMQGGMPRTFTNAPAPSMSGAAPGAAPGSMPPPSLASNQPGSSPMQGAMPGAMPPPASQNAAAGQSGGVFSQSQPPSSASPQQPSKGSLGISGYMLSLEKQQELGLSETGLFVTAVNTSGSPLQINDVILAISGQSFTTLAEARDLVQSAAGQTAQVRVHRSGSATEINVPLK